QEILHCCRVLLWISISSRIPTRTSSRNANGLRQQNRYCLVLPKHLLKQKASCPQQASRKRQEFLQMPQSKANVMNCSALKRTSSLVNGYLPVQVCRNTVMSKLMSNQNL